MPRPQNSERKYQWTSNFLEFQFRSPYIFTRQLPHKNARFLIFGFLPRPGRQRYSLNRCCLASLCILCPSLQISESSPNELSLRCCEGPYHHMATQQSFHHLLELRSHQPQTCAMFRHRSLPSMSGQMHPSTRSRRRFAKSAILLL